jgi:hypothetical protein
MLEALVKDVSIAQVAFVLVLALVILNGIKTARLDYRISKLGLRAPKRESWAPFGLDMAYRGVRSVVNNDVLPYFQGSTFPQGNL